MGREMWASISSKRSDCDAVDFLWSLWEQRRADRIAPTRSDFDLPFEIVPIIRHFAMTERRDGEILHRLYGSGLVDLFGMDWTGKPISLYREHGADWAVDMVEAVYRSATPARGTETVSWQGRDHVRFAWICLPVFDHNKHVAMTFGVVQRLP